MGKYFTVERVKNRSIDYILLSIVILLLGTGLAALFSASYFYSGVLYEDALYIFKKQLILTGVGIISIIFLSRLTKEGLKKLIPLFLVSSFVLSLLTFVPGIGAEILGARRWIRLFGFSFQPSELVKFSIILYLAHILSKKQERIDDLVNTILPPVLIVGVFTFLIYAQNDFSTAMFVLVISLAMFFIANVRVLYFVLLGTITIPLGLILLFTKEHRVQRLIAFLNPQTDPIGAGYQILAAERALLHGGLWGEGLGLGTRKLGGLPEAHSDFIFAVVGEEMGFIGVLFIISLFFAFAVRGYMVALRSENNFTYFLAFGITTSIFFQALFNMAVVGGIVPATGIPLPFFSSGGSSILLSLCMVGVLLNLSRSNEKEENYV
ncbi:MAG: putative lipid II flippase FtsW [Spirochaetia bacterium]